MPIPARSASISEREVGPYAMNFVSPHNMGTTTMADPGDSTLPWNTGGLYFPNTDGNRDWSIFNESLGRRWEFTLVALGGGLIEFRGYQLTYADTLNWSTTGATMDVHNRLLASSAQTDRVSSTSGKMGDGEYSGGTFWSSDGLILHIAEWGYVWDYGNEVIVYRFDCSTPYDISTSSYKDQIFFCQHAFGGVYSEYNAIHLIRMSSTGDKLFIAIKGTLAEIPLPVANDILSIPRTSRKLPPLTTWSHPEQGSATNYSLNSNHTGYYWWWNSTGTKFSIKDGYETSATTNTWDDSAQYWNYTLSTPFDLSTASLSSGPFNTNHTSSGSAYPFLASMDLWFSDDGLRSVSWWPDSSEFYHFSYSTPYDLSTATQLAAISSTGATHMWMDHGAGTVPGAGTFTGTIPAFGFKPGDLTNTGGAGHQYGLQFTNGVLSGVTLAYSPQLSLSRAFAGTWPTNANKWFGDRWPNYAQGNIISDTNGGDLSPFFDRTGTKIYILNYYCSGMRVLTCTTPWDITTINPALTTTVEDLVGLAAGTAYASYDWGVYIQMRPDGMAIDRNDELIWNITNTFTSQNVGRQDIGVFRMTSCPMSTYNDITTVSWCSAHNSKTAQWYQDAYWPNCGISDDGTQFVGSQFSWAVGSWGMDTHGDGHPWVVGYMTTPWDVTTLTSNGDDGYEHYDSPLDITSARRYNTKFSFGEGGAGLVITSNFILNDNRSSVLSKPNIRTGGGGRKSDYFGPIKFINNSSNVINIHEELLSANLDSVWPLNSEMWDPFGGSNDYPTPNILSINSNGTSIKLDIKGVTVGLTLSEPENFNSATITATTGIPRGTNSTGNIGNISWADNGNKAYAYVGGYAVQWNCATPYDITTGTVVYEYNMKDMTYGTTSYYTSLHMRADGTKLYMATTNLNHQADNLYLPYISATDTTYNGVTCFTEYDLSVAGDLSTCSAFAHGTGIGTSIGTRSWNSTAGFLGTYSNPLYGTYSALSFSADGTYMFRLGPNAFARWFLSTPWDVTTAGSFSSSSNGQDNCTNFHWKPDGTKLWVVDRAASQLKEYIPTVAWSPAINWGSPSVSIAIPGSASALAAGMNVGAVAWAHNGELLYVPVYNPAILNWEIYGYVPLGGAWTINSLSQAGKSTSPVPSYNTNGPANSDAVLEPIYGNATQDTTKFVGHRYSGDHVELIAFSFINTNAYPSTSVARLAHVFWAHADWSIPFQDWDAKGDISARTQPITYDASQYDSNSYAYPRRSSGLAVETFVSYTSTLNRYQIAYQNSGVYFFGKNGAADGNPFYVTYRAHPYGVTQNTFRTAANSIGYYFREYHAGQPSPGAKYGNHLEATNFNAGRPTLPICEIPYISSRLYDLKYFQDGTKAYDVFGSGSIDWASLGLTVNDWKGVTQLNGGSGASIVIRSDLPTIPRFDPKNEAQFDIKRYPCHTLRDPESGNHHYWTEEAQVTWISKNKCFSAWKSPGYGILAGIFTTGDR